MEEGVLVPLWVASKLVLPSAKLSEVLSRFRYLISEQLDLDPASRLLSDGDVEKNHWVGRVGQIVLLA